MGAVPTPSVGAAGLSVLKLISTELFRVIPAQNLSEKENTPHKAIFSHHEAEHSY